MQDKGLSNIVAAMLLVLLFFVGIYLIPWQSVKWGKLQFSPSDSITVYGYSESKEKSQVARFTAGVSQVSDDKDSAVSTVNKKVDDIINAVKSFGIAVEDIKTQNVSVYQQEESFWEEGRQKTRPGQWRVSNNVEITLRDVDRASELTDLLTSSGATNVFGPNFSLDDTRKAETDLLKSAIEDARKKAEVVAEASGKKLGEIITVTEGSGSSGVVPFYRAEMGGGGGAPIEPGTGTVSKTVTVTFEIK